LHLAPKSCVKRFGVRSMQLFGSVARNEQHDGSDVDICVDMPPKTLSNHRT